MNDNIIEFPTKIVLKGSYKNRQEYLMSCKEVLTEEDYREVLCGIMDSAFYDSLEEDLKGIVNNYFENKC